MPRSMHSTVAFDSLELEINAMLAADTVRAELRRQYEEALAEIAILQVEARRPMPPL